MTVTSGCKEIRAAWSPIGTLEHISISFFETQKHEGSSPCSEKAIESWLGRQTDIPCAFSINANLIFCSNFSSTLPDSHFLEWITLLTSLFTYLIMSLWLWLAWILRLGNSPRCRTMSRSSRLEMNSFTRPVESVTMLERASNSTSRFSGSHSSRASMTIVVIRRSLVILRIKAVHSWLSSDPAAKPSFFLASYDSRTGCKRASPGRRHDICLTRLRRMVSGSDRSGSALLRWQ